MADERKIIFTAKLNASQVTEELQAVEKESADTGAGMQKDFAGVDGVLGALPKSLMKIAGGIKKFVLGLKSMRVALMATGVGLIVVAFAALSSYFTKTQRGAEKLEVATAALGAGFDVVVDVLSSLGELIMGVFTNPKKALEDFAGMVKKFVTDKIAAIVKLFGILGGVVSDVFSGKFGDAMDGAKEAVKLYATEISLTGQIITKAVSIAGDAAVAFGELASRTMDAASAATTLARRSIQLRKDQRDLNVEMAASRAEIKAYKLIAEDLTKDVNDRIAAQQTAMDLEQGLMTKRVKLAEEERDIQKAKMDLAESTEEDFVRLSELEVALSNVRLNSLGQQKALIVRLNALRLEAQAIIDKQVKDEQTALEKRFKGLELLEAATLDKQTKETDAVAKKFDKLLELAAEFGYDEQVLYDQQDAEVAALNKKWADKELAEAKVVADKKTALDKSVYDSKVAMTKVAFGALIALNSAFSAKGDKEAKAQFDRNKALGIAVATINTYLAITDALAKDGIGPGMRFVSAAAAGVMGIANVMKISQTQFGGMTTPSAGGAGLSPAGVSPSSAPQLDLGFLGQGSGSQMGRSYVISQEVSNSQQANQLVNDQAALYL